MSEWVLQGLREGVKSTRYPKRAETAAGVSPGLPSDTSCDDPQRARSIAGLCPTDALLASDRTVTVDRGRCIDCYRCARATPAAMRWDLGYEWGSPTDEGLQDSSRRLGSAFGRSLHVRVVDGGDCSACLSEVAQLTGPYYSLHRLGFFITPTPREADALIVVGPVTPAMRPLLRATYDAMPAPKRVIAVGACAISGGIFRSTRDEQEGALGVIPVDVVVPGCPPPPLAIIHALLVTVERAPARAVAQ